jgi:hypothetical protein
MEKATNDTVMVTPMKETFQLVKLTVKEYITGPTVKYTMGSGAVVSKKGMACGKEYMVTATWVSGVSLKHMVMGFISGKMETDMKAAGSSV